MNDSSEFFHSAYWYDISINWSARLGREIPLLRKVFGPPGELGLLDAGCGTGRQAAELARQGYRVTGLDLDEGMLKIGIQHARDSGSAVDFIRGSYDELPNLAPGPFDGIYCLANALAACGSAESVRNALASFASVLRPGGRLFVQMLNFPPMRDESPSSRGPRVVLHEGIEYVSTRTFRFGDDSVEVLNVTHYKKDRWHHHASAGRLYPISPDEMHTWCSDAGLHVDERFGAYDRAQFDTASSNDLIVVATKL